MSINQSPIQFTPRQVVMLGSQSTKNQKEKKTRKKGSSAVLEGSKEIVLDGGDLSARGKGREILLRSIAGFLETNGFKKTLAVFQSEAQIEENSWKSPVANLDDLFAKFSDSRDALVLPALDGHKPQDAIKEPEKKKRKKGTGETDEEQLVEKTGKAKPVEEEVQKEAKGKRKKKKSSEEQKPDEEKEEPNEGKKEKVPDPCENGNVKAEENGKNKEKEGKRKKKKEIMEGKEADETKGNENATVGESKDPNQEKREKKKKKESDASGNEKAKTEENDTKKKHNEEKKKKKKESQDGKETQEKDKYEVAIEEMNVENGAKAVSKKRKKGEEENDVKKRKSEQTNGNTKTTPEAGHESKNSDDDLKEQKSGKKEKQAAEPKSANAFQRVKVEAVRFSDERLQDNSYWAKGGADSGYGAKAQQILEQVRGRDFRHEKTKKKRGTYRGGEIDLQSHSIKFNYSDEE